MAESLSSHEYERLADIELRAASSSKDNSKSRGHLNQASVYAYLAEGAGPGPVHSPSVDHLIELLRNALGIADGLKLASASIHIDAAVIALGGPGTAPPEA